MEAGEEFPTNIYIVVVVTYDFNVEGEHEERPGRVRGTKQWKEGNEGTWRKGR